MKRIETLDKSLATQLKRLAPESRNSLLNAVCAELCSSFPSLPVEIHESVKHIGAATKSTRTIAETAAQKLDEAYLALHDADAECEAEFAISRAAAAISFALQTDGFEECLYESNFAFDDLEKLKAIVRKAIA